MKRLPVIAKELFEGFMKWSRYSEQRTVRLECS